MNQRNTCIIVSVCALWRVAWNPGLWRCWKKPHCPCGLDFGGIFFECRFFRGISVWNVSTFAFNICRMFFSCFLFVTIVFDLCRWKVQAMFCINVLVLMLKSHMGGVCHRLLADPCKWTRPEESRVTLGGHGAPGLWFAPDLELAEAFVSYRAVVDLWPQLRFNDEISKLERTPCEVNKHSVYSFVCVWFVQSRQHVITDSARSKSEN